MRNAPSRRSTLPSAASFSSVAPCADSVTAPASSDMPRSSSGVPLATILPRSMMIARVHAASTSSRMCVEKAKLDHALHGFPARLAFEPAQRGGEIEKALHRHFGIGGGVLGQVADQALRLERRFDDVVAADRDAAGGGRHESRDHAHGGRLPRAVRAEEAEHFAALDGERNAVDGPLGAEGLHQSLDFYHAKRGAELSPNYAVTIGRHLEAWT